MHHNLDIKSPFHLNIVPLRFSNMHPLVYCVSHVFISSLFYWLTSDLLFLFTSQRWLSMPAALRPSCWGRPYLPSPRTWTLTPTACPSACVLVSPLLTSLPWFLCGCSPLAWYVATPTWWSPLNGSPDAPCSWPKCSRMPEHQMVQSTSSTASTQVSVCLSMLIQKHTICVCG